ncbi:unnamed protein product, partial [Meganyctiphanes norvegica]
KQERKHRDRKHSPTFRCIGTLTLRLAMWTPTPFETYRCAIYDEGKLTLSVVTKHLYEGGNMRPDLYFILQFGEQQYKCTFNKDQQLILENYGAHFDIGTAVKDYDISLQYLLLENVCGLSPKGHIDWQEGHTLENKLSKLHKRRNKVTHTNWSMINSYNQSRVKYINATTGQTKYLIPQDRQKSHEMNRSELRLELLALWKLYGAILNDVAERANCNVDCYKRSITKGLESKDIYWNKIQ